ncbi:hypothetical protein [Granulicella sp. S190]|uniref:hypothetical protein n=1 Tax=Granulicella sp. S190 TaxID=1747226 RepID=UPI00131AA7ED|nr:hypothetical protein [Granulicella sp. S190]
MNLRPITLCVPVALMAVLTTLACAAQTKSSGSEPVPPLLRPKPPVVEPTMPPAHPFHDGRYGITFTVPAAWELNRKDAEVSTFNLDARSVARTTQLRAVASISFNPHPNSTFSGALFYFSVTPHLTPAECSSQATIQAPRTASTAQIGGIPFTHGYDEHGGICTESRDEIYTTAHNNSCYRFDAVINTFCGGDVSGVQDISPRELDSVRKRMQKILDSVHFDTN